MSRKRRVDPVELLKQTEKLLMEVGYPSFHFRLLAERLGVARSTIYEYYSNKEELVTDYMKEVMRQINEECSEIDPHLSPINKITAILRIFLNHSQMHQIIQYTPLIASNATPQVRADLMDLAREHNHLYQWLFDLINQAKQQGEIHQDVPTNMLAQMIFYSIFIPNHEQLPIEQFANQLEKIIFDEIRIK
jgi:AcrR family transcriptional regulator